MGSPFAAQHRHKAVISYGDNEAAGHKNSCTKREAPASRTSNLLEAHLACKHCGAAIRHCFCSGPDEENSQRVEGKKCDYFLCCLDFFPLKSYCLPHCSSSSGPGIKCINSVSALVGDLILLMIQRGHRPL